jgi:hypothetical protein
MLVSSDQKTAPAEHVRSTASHEQQGTKRQGIAGNYPLQLRGPHPQRPLNRRQRHVDDAEVELKHELRGHDERQGEPRIRRFMRSPLDHSVLPAV